MNPEIKAAVDRVDEVGQAIAARLGLQHLGGADPLAIIGMLMAARAFAASRDDDDDAMAPLLFMTAEGVLQAIGLTEQDIASLERQASA